MFLMLLVAEALAMVTMIAMVVVTGNDGNSGVLAVPVGLSLLFLMCFAVILRRDMQDDYYHRPPAGGNPPPTVALLALPAIAHRSFVDRVSTVLSTGRMRLISALYWALPVRFR